MIRTKYRSLEIKKIHLPTDTDRRNNEFLIAHRHPLICSVCHKPVGRGESISHNGYNLICYHCWDSISDCLGVTTPSIMRLIQKVGAEKEQMEGKE